MWLLKKKTTEEKIQELEEKIAGMEEEFRLWNIIYKNDGLNSFRVEHLIKLGAKIAQFKCRLMHYKTQQTVG